MTEQTHWKPLACGTILLMLLVVVAFGQGHPSAPVYDVNGIVTDVRGAVIATAIVVFESSKYNLEVFTAQTGTDGSMHLRIPSGHYVVTVYIRGFKAIKVADFAVEASTPAVLKVVLDPAKVERSIGDGEAVPDSATAIGLAEAVLGAEIGEKKTRSLRPFTASLYEGVWSVTRRCKTVWCAGNDPTVMILQRDGRVIFNQSIYLK
jgi:hypothetical protein